MRLIIRTIPGPVSKLEARITTIVGVLMWKFNNNQSGGYPVKRFTADFRKMPNEDLGLNGTAWIRLDPSHITPNAVS